jgi:hypothetical protein
MLPAKHQGFFYFLTFLFFSSYLHASLSIANYQLKKKYTL